MTLCLVALTLVLLGILYSFIHAHQSQILYTATEENAQNLADRLVTALAQPLQNRNATRVEEICNLFRQNNLVDEIRVEDIQGRTIHSSVKSAELGSTLEIQKEIFYEKRSVGKLYLICSLRAYEYYNAQLLNANVFLLSCLALALFVAIGFLLRVFLHSPLQKLLRVIDAVSKGDFSGSSSLPYAELASIATRFARMGSDLELRESELNHLNEALQKEKETGAQDRADPPASEERYSLAMQGSNDGFWDWDLRTNTIYYSPRWKAMLGYASDELKHDISEWLVRIAPDDQQWVQKKIQDYQNGLVDDFQFEYRLQHKNGSYRWIHTRGLCLWDKSGKAYRIAGANTDITDRKTFEDYVWEAKSTLDNVLNAMPSKIIGVNKAGRITLWNSTSAKEAGKSRGEVINSLFSTAMPEFNFLQHDIRRAIAEEQTITLKRLSTTGPTGTRYHDVIIYPVVMYGTYNAIVRIDDITERVLMEEIMVQTEKMLSVGGLAAGMAHEINNPLGGILQGAQNILRRLDPELPPNLAACEQIGCDMRTIRTYMEQRDIIRFLEGIRESGARAASIVTNMLEFSRRSDTACGPVCVPQLIQRTLELAANDYDLKKQYDFRHINIIEQYSPELPELICSATELQQVLLNLLKNAAQAMPLRDPNRSDPPAITLQAEAKAGEMHISVSDNGPGMREEIRRRIFEPFFTTKAAGEGTGLGLPVSYFIVASNHEGNLSVTSEPGKGSTFYITLPIGGPSRLGTA